MATENGAAAPIIIKRVEGESEGGHHGGAWKVAYADFVTAMMAFFLLMWLLNATTEKQRQGLADYFNPTVVRAQSGAGGTLSEDDSVGEESQSERIEQLHQHLQNELDGIGAESMQKANLLRHVVTRVTDEGLVIELSDLSKAPLFEGDTARPSRALVELSAMVARVISGQRNQVAVTGHVHAFPNVLANSPAWPLSDARAHATRKLMESAGLRPRRVQRVTGYADRRNRPDRPMDPSNNRIEVILLR